MNTQDRSAQAQLTEREKFQELAKKLIQVTKKDLHDLLRKEREASLKVKPPTKRQST